MKRERRIVTAIVAGLMVLGASAGGSRAARSLAGTKTTAPALAWRSIPPMQTARYAGGATWFGGPIIVIGGFDSHGAALSSVESYDLDYDRWTAEAPMPTARGDFGIDWHGDFSGIDVFGGADSHGRLLDVVEKYAPDSNHWYHLTTMPQPRRGMAVAHDGDAGNMLVAGGIGPGGKVLNSVWLFNPARHARGLPAWSSIAPMHAPRYDFALVFAASNGEDLMVYAIGGFGPGRVPLRSVEAYDWRTKRWTAKPPMPTARGGLAASAAKSLNTITVAGGFDGAGRALGSVEQFNVLKNTWAVLSPMPVARGDFPLVNTEGGSESGLFALGGRGAGGAVLASVSAGEAPLPPGWSLDTPLPVKWANLAAVRGADGIIYAISGDGVDAFNPTTHRWNVRAPLPYGPGWVTAAAGPDGKIYVMGGIDWYSGTPLRTLEAYDPRTNTWSARAPMPVGRTHAAAVTGKDGKIYVFGGAKPDPSEGDNSLYTRSLDVYDPVKNSWQVRAPMPTAREGLGAAVAPDGTIYAIGGGTSHYKVDLCFSTVEVYHPQANTWTKGAPLSTKMCDVTAGTTANGTMYAVAGTIEALSPGSSSWHVLTSTPLPRGHPGVAVAPDGTVYVIGGLAPAVAPSATVQRFRAGS